MKRGRKTRVSGTQKHGKELGEEQDTYYGLPITELPNAISVDILLRLSANILLLCRCVCKKWRNLISNPEFAKLHLAKGEVYPLIRSLSPIHVSRTLYLVEPPVYNYSNYMDCCCHINWLSCKVHCKRKLDTKLKLPLRNFDLALNTQRETDANIQSNGGSKRKRCTKLRTKDHRFNVVNSCNGLLCLSEPIKNDPVAVCNPITGEYINLPDPTQDKIGNKKLVDCALGFSPNTSKYKVIRMFCHPDQDCQFTQEPITGKHIYNCRVAEIHTLGTSSWTRIGYAPSSYEKLGFPTYLNGSVHWLYPDDKTLDYIISFDFVNERFRPIPPPRKFDIYHDLSYKDISLGEFGGCLCISYFDDGELDVWVMEDYGVQSSWTRKYRLNATCDEGRYLWGIYQPISVLKNGGGLLLFHRRGSALLSYDAEGSDFKYLKLRGVKSKYEAIPYVPSFVSLKDVLAGEESDVININSRCGGLKLQGETKALYLEEADADFDSDLNPSSYTYSDGDDCESS